MSRDASYRQILRSTSIIGGASVLNIVIGLVRIKIAAVVLGPIGVGLIGLLNSLLVTAASVAALGIGTVGTRQVAEAVTSDDPQAVATIRHAMMVGTAILALLGTLAFWMLRDVLAIHVLHDASLGTDVGWLAIGVGLTVVTGTQSSLLNGLRRIGDLARVTVYSALLSAVLGSAAIFILGQKGLLVFMLLAPLSRYLFGQWYVMGLPEMSGPPRNDWMQQWPVLARLGVAFMIAGLASTFGQLLVRTLVQQHLGTDALGYFEAAWVISMTYIGFVLSAMGTDFYPRLTAVFGDSVAFNRLINEQSEVALILAGPVFIGMLGVAPWVVEVLYSSKFIEAASILRWQIFGDILKVLSWPLGYAILARGRGRTFMLTEMFSMGLFVLFVWAGLPSMGLQATGIGFLVMYVGYLPLVYWLAHASTGFRWKRAVAINLLFLLLAGTVVGLTAAQWPLAGAILGVVTALAFGFFGLARLDAIGIFGGPIGKLSRLHRSLTGKIGLRNEN